MERVLPTIDRKQLLRIIRFMRRISMKWLMAILACSFILASGFSLYMSFVFLPVSKTGRGKAKTGSESFKFEKSKTSKADQEIILTRNIFNSDGKTGDSVDGVARPGGPRVSDKPVKSDLP
ncbi:MAG: hypothetical protein NTX25_22665, partial [Proteobacteria bacterium]|nr:hypothetical protein [Pseudomonadota bacterium]